MNEALAKLIQQIQNAAPKVWDAALQQVTIDKWEMIGGFILLLAGAIVIQLLIFYAARHGDCDEVGIATAFVWLIFLAVSILLWINIISYAYNPTWQAIKYIKGM